MDDLVVIILTLVIAGFGLLGQIKKQKQNQPLPADENPPDSIWDLFNPDVIDSGKIPEPVFEEIEQDEEMETIETPLYQFRANNEGISEVKEKKISKRMERNVPTHNKENFSLRKAVIYSEILNQKYI